MEKKTLAEIMAEPATVEAIIKKAMEINELLLKVENMPEVDEIVNIDGCPPLRKVKEPYCMGCFFYEQSELPCPSNPNCGEVPKDDHIIFVKA